MSFLYTVFISPLELFFEVCFVFFQKAFSNYGLSIVGLSLVITIVTLPLYHVAEQIQKKERDDRKRLERGIRRIKETFKGDEQFMMLSTFYRQNHYHPAYVLRGSVGLLIQVPFFIAAYHFLSHLSVLQGTSLSFIRDLGAPDQLLKIGNVSINLLPILMTAINIGSGIIYTKGFALRDKVQLYGMAGLFLVLLYTSPAGLVLYWTLNNFFSLVKNVFYKLTHPLRVAYLLIVLGTTIVVGYIWIDNPLMGWAKKGTLLVGWLFIGLLPLLLIVTKRLLHLLHDYSEHPKTVNAIFLSSLVILFLLYGLVAPSNLIYSSVIEFSNVGNVGNPLMYIGQSILLFLGMWVVWPLFLYALSNKSIRTLFSICFSVFAIISIINVFLFPGDYGVISYLLQFEDSSRLFAQTLELVLPLVLALVVGVVVYVLVWKNHTRILQAILSILVLGLASSGGYLSAAINKEYKDYARHLAVIGEEQVKVIKPQYHFSKQGRNVLFIFLDRGMSSFLPFILEEDPNLRDQLAGFTYYPNTVSFGNMTLYGSPPMFGGYEYTPDEINKRGTEKLVDKHNEALLVLPKLFLDAGFDVTLNDPPFSNYKWEGDFTPFRAYPEINIFHHLGPYSTFYKDEHAEDLNWRPENAPLLITRYLPMFTMLKATFPFLRSTLYDDGRYFLTTEDFQSYDLFLASYSQLYYLRELSSFDAIGDVYINISNNATHDPAVLQTPEYEPRTTITNSMTPLDGLFGVRETDRLHFYVNVAALKRIGLWMEQLREEGVYDNTRIVIVADHGSGLYSEGLADFSKGRAYNSFVPLLLMKDFNSNRPLNEDYTFMTNADAALFAIQDVTNTINPFTGKNIFEQVKKDRVNVYTGSFDPRANSGTRFNPYLESSFSIGEDIFEEENWKPVEIQGANR